MRKIKGPKCHHFIISSSFHHSQLTWRSRTSYLAIDDESDWCPPATPWLLTSFPLGFWLELLLFWNPYSFETPTLLVAVNLVEFLSNLTQKEHPAIPKLKFIHTKLKTVLHIVILKLVYPDPQLHQSCKPVGVLFCTNSLRSDLN